ncbi:MAG: RagB/SusD family nutrient uptake outer membrane protein [Bacteroidales bacterium]|nr:RagB/SusD family nutrient uptake outer membrane protein [Bacteroidales bacterium]MDD6751937.1 RagB/SusD family nutrient uptake outer membrane protein [Bacteroidales bacterium]
MKNQFKTILTAAALVAGLSSCEKFLDTTPDNRATVDSEEKVVALLGSAYSDHDYLLINELYSDNVDNYSVQFKNTSIFYDAIYNWTDIVESNNESTENIWGTFYGNIASANQAIIAIEELGGPEVSDVLSQAYGEAYLCRAFAHFILVNTFCLQYNKNTSSKDLGLPYMTEPETTLVPQYERGNVADVYSKIDADIQMGLKYVGDDNYSVPKYHFNKAAAYAFAARFYLFYEKYDKVIEYADACLGSAPATMLRDYDVLGTMPNGSPQQHPTTLHYVDPSVNANLLLLTAYSVMGQVFGGYSTANMYSHGAYIAKNEDCQAAQPWGSSAYKDPPSVYSGSLDKVIFWRLPRIFQYTDPVAGIGFNRTVYPAFTTDECLLNRAEAYVHLGQYDKACDDLNLWATNCATAPAAMTPESITAFYAAIPYWTWDKSTVKKKINPVFGSVEEGSVEESMYQCILAAKRVETLGLGLRWWDVKRFGIEIQRRKMNMSGVPEELIDTMPVDDPRRAIQIPARVINAGIKANPRNSK